MTRASRTYEDLRSTFLRMKRRPTCALAMLLDHMPMLQHAALKHLDPDILSLIVLPMLHMPQVKDSSRQPQYDGARGAELL